MAGTRCLLDSAPPCLLPTPKTVAIGVLLLSFVLGAGPARARAAGEADDAAVRALVDTAADPTAGNERRATSIEQLKLLGPAAVPVLLERLHDPDGNVRAVAASALGQVTVPADLREQVVDALTERLERDRDVRVRVNAIVAIGAARNPKALKSLIRALQDGDARVRNPSVVALMQIHRPEAIAPLMQAFHKERERDIRLNIVKALGSLRALNELETLHTSVTDPIVYDEIEAQLATLRPMPNWVAGREREGRRAAGPAHPTQAQQRYFLLIRAKNYLPRVGLGLLLMPGALLGIGSLSSIPLRGWPIRIGVAGFGVALALLFGALASLPVSRLSANPASGFVALLPFLDALSIVPVALCACFIRPRVAGRWLNALINALAWAGIYAAVEFGTWHVVPLILEGNYFWYGHHPRWEPMHAALVIAVWLTVLVMDGVANLGREDARWRGPLDRLRLGPYLAVVSPCVVILSLGYLVLNLYSY
jgi:HEAT repeats/HEAT repeat